MAKTKTTPAPRGGGKGAFYRLMRDWHGYLSALAFAALLMFSASGLFLNHPDTLTGGAVTPVEKSVTLSAADLARAKAAPEPGKAVSEAVGKQLKLAGTYRSGDLAGTEMFIRLEGMSGSTDLRADMETGKVDITLAKANLIQMMNDLHKGVVTGPVWKIVIDVVAIVVFVMSILGYILFFSLRFRIKTALVLSIGSLVVMLGLIFFLVH